MKVIALTLIDAKDARFPESYRIRLVDNDVPSAAFRNLLDLHTPAASPHIAELRPRRYGDVIVINGQVYRHTINGWDTWQIGRFERPTFEAMLKTFATDHAA